jgi:hypothetical protein
MYQKERKKERTGHAAALLVLISESYKLFWYYGKTSGHIEKRATSGSCCKWNQMEL